MCYASMRQKSMKEHSSKKRFTRWSQKATFSIGKYIEKTTTQHNTTKKRVFQTAFKTNKVPFVSFINWSFVCSNAIIFLIFNFVIFSYRNFCIPPIKGYSGVAVLSKEKAISVKQGIDIYDHSQEGRILTVEYAEFYLVVVYVPNSGGGLKRLDYRVNSFDKDF